MAKKKGLDVDFDLSDASINAPQSAEVSDSQNDYLVNTDQVESIKRLTLDMPSSLHKKLKIMAMNQDTTMAKMIRKWLEDKVN